MRILGIDYGSKRVGIALSDEGRQFGMPLITINNSKNTLKEVIEIAKINNVKEIVIGESKNYKGEANTILPESLNFKMDLEKEGYAVFLEPEFMTSANAERFQGKTNMLDASAAALILQSFLDKEQANKYSYHIFKFNL
jgi:putative Holliday junction resolvase